MDGLQQLFREQNNTHASFLCVLSYMDEHLLEPKQYIGTTQGSIDFSFLDKVTVDLHLPYLSIFVPEGMDTVAQMNTSFFESNHHRTKASEALKEYIASSFI
jgi:inosine/xanthosine triphosphate pyrophosphatase family protein